MGARPGQLPPAGQYRASLSQRPIGSCVLVYLCLHEPLLCVLEQWSNTDGADHDPKMNTDIIGR